MSPQRARGGARHAHGYAIPPTGVLATPEPGAAPLLRWLDPMHRALILPLLDATDGDPADRCRQLVDELRERLRCPVEIGWEHDAYLAAFEAMFRHPREAMDLARSRP